ncbi:hypothetical protein BJ508DRAFT_357681 [Ascobolus immersus RN42]|uniref:SH3 domain-containing protein n=1 Tax=Ascobolus immersus RN42 TaxID=1160509 RepID=A0A3N4IMY3_ASCIM|nr:hypothetical protein BJ508DRAFT_357681 [Ascobolus immersus RN42]
MLASPPMAPSTTSAAHRSLRTIQTELEYLVEVGHISGHTASQITSLLPSPPPLQFATTPTSSAAPSVRSPTAEPTHTPYAPPQSYNTVVPIREKTPLPLAVQTPPPPPPPPPTPAPPPAYALPADAFRAKALWAYEEKNPGDLNFKAGQFILVLKKENDEWWSGRCIDGTTNEPVGPAGIFPCAYVEAVKNEVAAGGKGHVSGDMGTGFLNTSFGGGSKNEDGKESNGKKFGKKLGNAAIFGAGATIGGNLVNAIF